VSPFAAVNLALGLFFLATHVASRSLFSKGQPEHNGQHDEQRPGTPTPTSTAPAASAPAAGADGQYDERRASQSPTPTTGAAPNASRGTSSNAVRSQREHVHRESSLVGEVLAPGPEKQCQCEAPSCLWVVLYEARNVLLTIVHLPWWVFVLSINRLVAVLFFMVCGSLCVWRHVSGVLRGERPRLALRLYCLLVAVLLMGAGFSSDAIGDGPGTADATADQLRSPAFNPPLLETRSQEYDTVTDATGAQHLVPGKEMLMEWMVRLCKLQGSLSTTKANQHAVDENGQQVGAKGG